jgi:hypothetical protein
VVFIGLFKPRKLQALPPVSAVASPLIQWNLVGPRFSTFALSWREWQSGYPNLFCHHHGFVAQAEGSDLGHCFHAEIDSEVRRMADNPRQFPTVFKNLRRAHAKNFPYALFFSSSPMRAKRDDQCAS